jgi:uridine phosphorylase
MPFAVDETSPRIGCPPVCLLEFDGDLTDWIVGPGIAKTHRNWACFHTAMHAIDVDGTECGIVARTIGGPYAVLFAEQLKASGAEVTSAGRVSGSLPLPSLVVVQDAIRDEGTSHHYLPPGELVQSAAELAGHAACGNYCAAEVCR